MTCFPMRKLPGDIFDKLVRLGAYLVGPPAILEMRARGEQIWVKIVKRSPLFSLQVRFGFDFPLHLLSFQMMLVVDFVVILI